VRDVNHSLPSTDDIMNEWRSVYTFLSWRAKGNLDHYQNDPVNDPHYVGFFFFGIKWEQS